MQTWTFGPAGIYTATWDGISKVTVTLTAGGAFVASFFAQSLTAAVASPEYQAILSPAPSALSDLRLVATTGVNGFALQNATPTILSWTAPSDGNTHRVTLVYLQHCTSAQTGGAIGLPFTEPDGNIVTHSVSAGGNGAGTTGGGSYDIFVQAGSTISLNQTSAQTAGAATVWVQLWAS